MGELFGIDAVVLVLAAVDGLEVEGMGLRMVESGTGRQMEAYISELRDDGALLDLNHPLAGETLHFNVEVVGLRRATSEEIAHGHAPVSYTHLDVYKRQVGTGRGAAQRADLQGR